MLGALCFSFITIFQNNFITIILFPIHFNSKGHGADTFIMHSRVTFEPRSVGQPSPSAFCPCCPLAMCSSCHTSQGHLTSESLSILAPENCRKVPFLNLDRWCCFIPVFSLPLCASQRLRKCRKSLSAPGAWALLELI